MAFVSHFAPGPIECQFKVLAGEHPEGDGHAALQCGVADSFGDLVVDVFVVSGFALDDGSKADHGVEVPRVSQSVGDE